MKKKWILSNTDKNKKNILLQLSNKSSLKNISKTCLEVLYNRGYKTEESILNFLDMTIEDVHNPYLLKDCEKAVDLIIDLNKKEDNPLIVNFSDYDCDGITSSVLSVLALRELGFNVEFYTNNRFVEGYGINKMGVDHLLEKYPDVKLIYTTDNGIVGYEGINYAKSKGIKVIVTDHHEPGDYPPNADAVVNPKQKDCNYPFKELCGAGVIFKVICLLYHKLGRNIEEAYKYLDILGLGTVCDMVSLSDENRVFVKEGLRRVKEENRPAFKILRELTEVKDITEYTFGFIYGPMLNAPGRLDGSPEKSIQLFLEKDEKKIKEIVKYLIDINNKRKILTEEGTEFTLNKIKEKGEIKEAIVCYDKSFQEGVVGLIAGRIKETLCRPTIVLAPHFKKIINEDGIEEEIRLYKGSARSIEGFHIKNAFDTLKGYLQGYGGHSMAAGLSILEKDIEKFTEELCNLVKSTLSEEDFVPKILIDTVISPSDLTVDLIEEIETLKPFGQGFSSPNFGIKDVSIEQFFFMGSENQHLKLTTKEKKSLIMFNGVDFYKSLGLPQNIKAVGYPSLNLFNNKINVQFIIKDENMVNSN